MQTDRPARSWTDMLGVLFWLERGAKQRPEHLEPLDDIPQAAALPVHTKFAVGVFDTNAHGTGL